MAAFIKRILKSKQDEPQTYWADYREKRQFEFEREQWVDNQWLRAF